MNLGGWAALLHIQQRESERRHQEMPARVASLSTSPRVAAPPHVIEKPKSVPELDSPYDGSLIRVDTLGLPDLGGLEGLEVDPVRSNVIVVGGTNAEAEEVAKAAQRLRGGELVVFNGPPTRLRFDELPEAASSRDVWLFENLDGFGQNGVASLTRLLQVMNRQDVSKGVRADANGDSQGPLAMKSRSYRVWPYELDTLWAIDGSAIEYGQVALEAFLIIAHSQSGVVATALTNWDAQVILGRAASDATMLTAKGLVEAVRQTVERDSRGSLIELIGSREDDGVVAWGETVEVVWSSRAGKEFTATVVSLGEQFECDFNEWPAGHYGPWPIPVTHADRDLFDRYCYDVATQAGLIIGQVRSVWPGLNVRLNWDKSVSRRSYDDPFACVVQVADVFEGKVTASFDFTGAWKAECTSQWPPGTFGPWPIPWVDARRAETPNLQPNDGWAILARANALTDLGRFAEALDELDRVPELSPALRTATVSRVWNLCNSGRDEEALAIGTKLLESGVGSPSELCNDYVNRALALSHLGRLDEALLDLGRGLELVPNDPDATYEKARALSKQGSYGAALEFLRNAISYDDGRRARALQDGEFRGLAADSTYGIEFANVVAGHANRRGAQTRTSMGAAVNPASARRLG